MKLVFVHIPKTAGTSFHNILSKNYGKDNIIWDEHNSIRPLFTNPKSYDMFDIIYGHFTIEKYNYLNRPKITIMRDPVERVISEYYYLLKIIKHGNENDLVVSSHIDKFRSICDWAEFRPNLQYTFMKDTSNFDWIGVVEYFSLSLKFFESWSKTKLMIKNTYIRKNENKLEVSPKHREYIRQFNKLDYELYDEVLKRYEKE